MKYTDRTSSVVPWLRPHAPSAGDMGLKIPHAMQHGQKTKTQNKIQYTENNVVFLNSSYCCLLKGSEPNTFFLRSRRISIGEALKTSSLILRVFPRYKKKY